MLLRRHLTHAVIPNEAGRLLLPLSLLRKRRPAQRGISLRFPQPSNVQRSKCELCTPDGFAQGRADRAYQACASKQSGRALGKVCRAHQTFLQKPSISSFCSRLIIHDRPGIGLVFQNLRFLTGKEVPWLVRSLRRELMDAHR